MCSGNVIEIVKALYEKLRRISVCSWKNEEELVI